MPAHYTCIILTPTAELCLLPLYFGFRVFICVSWCSLNTPYCQPWLEIGGCTSPDGFVYRFFCFCFSCLSRAGARKKLSFLSSVASPTTLEQGDALNAENTRPFRLFFLRPTRTRDRISSILRQSPEGVRKFQIFTWPMNSPSEKLWLQNGSPASKYTEQNIQKKRKTKQRRGQHLLSELRADIFDRAGCPCST